MHRLSRPVDLRVRLWRHAALALWAGWLALTFDVQAQGAATEPAVKAAYIYRFLPYVEWPESALGAPGRPLQIGVIGADPVAAALTDIVVGRDIQGRPVAVRVLRAAERLEGLHAVFVGAGVPVRGIVERLGTQSVLVVNENGLEPAAMLSLVKVAGKIRFEAAPSTAERAGLKLGARLLAVAERVAPP